MSRPWMPMSQRSFIANTWGMTAEEVGAFCMIWAFLAAQDGTYDLSEQSLANVCRLSVRRWRRIAPRVLQLFTQNGNILALPPKRPVSSIPVAAKKFVFGRDGNRCTYCGTAEGSFDVDHIIPRSRGGSNAVDNLCVACVRCNRRKNARTREEWVR